MNGVYQDVTQKKLDAILKLLDERKMQTRSEKNVSGAANAATPEAK